MRAQVEHRCLSCSPDGCPDQLIVFEPKFREYGLPVRDGGSSVVNISFCPFCGQRLPESARDAWFRELERRGVDDPDDAPLDMRTGAWRRQD